MARDYEAILVYGERNYRIKSYREPRQGEIWLHPDCYPARRNGPEVGPRFVLEEVELGDAILMGTAPATNPERREQ